MTTAQRRSLAGAALAASTVATLWAADPLAQWGITAANAHERIVNQVLHGRGPEGAVMSVFKKLPVSTRVTLTQESMAWARTFTESAAFRTAYLQARTAAKPEPLVFTQSVDDEIKAELAKQEADMKEGMQGMSSLPAEQRRQIEAQMTAMLQQMKGPEMQKILRDGKVMEREESQRRFQEDTTRWQTDYPENPRALMASRLRRFLEVSGTVDFAAPTTVKNGATVFTNPQYEQKPGDWKMYYRAGRETVGAARTFAQTWLRELEAAR